MPAPAPHGQVQVWDRFVRLGHWSLVAAFAVAYLSAEESEDVHVVAGYCVGAYVLARIAWRFERMCPSEMHTVGV